MSHLINKTPSNSNTKYVEVTNEVDQRVLTKSRMLISAINMLFFGISLLLFIIGIFFLTIYMYDFAFTEFNTTLVAGLFIGLGVIVIALTIINLILVQSGRNQVVLLSSTLIVLMFMALLGIGIWGLAVSTDEDNLRESVRNNILNAIGRYDETKKYRYETMKIDWLQERFNCCGISSYNDWKSFYLYGGLGGAGGGGMYANKPVNWINQWSVNGNLPYVDNVPDSCCVSKQFNCGKQYFNNLNNNINYGNNFNTLNNNPNNINIPGVYNSQNNYNYRQNSINRNMMINTNGCLDTFLQRFNRDILFLSALCVAASLLVIILYVILLFGFFFIKKSTY